MKDTVLAAMKRSARAVLRDELRAMRKELRQLRANQCVISTLQAQAERAQRDATLYSNALAQLRNRANRAVDWARQYAAPQGNNAALALTQWVVQGDTGGDNCHGLHPFDRWQIGPKP